MVVSDPDLIFYRDRASQYGSVAFCSLLNQAGLRQNLSARAARGLFIVGEIAFSLLLCTLDPVQKASQRITPFAVETEIHKNFR